MAMVAKCVEIVLGKKVDVETVAFSPEASKKDKNSIIELVASWSSVVETVLVFLASQTATGEAERTNIRRSVP